MCGNNCEIPIQTLTDNREEQNSAVLNRMRTLQGQMLLVDDHCTTENSTEENIATSQTNSRLCVAARNQLHQFTQNITDHVRIGSSICG